MRALRSPSRFPAPLSSQAPAPRGAPAVEPASVELNHDNAALNALFDFESVKSAAGRRAPSATVPPLGTSAAGPVTQGTPSARGRGRPKGSRNKQRTQPKAPLVHRVQDITRPGDTATTGISVPYDMLLAAKQCAHDRGMTFSAYVVSLIEHDMAAQH